MGRPRLYQTGIIRGQRGEPGVNAIPADEFIADRLDDDTSETYAAITAGFTVGQVVTHPRWGADKTGAIDSTIAIQDCIDFVGAQGGGVVRFPAGVYLISSKLTVSAHGVMLVGEGAGAMSEETVEQLRGAATTRILFSASATPAIMLEFTSVAAGPPLTGGGAEGIMLDGNNQATRCLSIASWRSGRFVDLVLYAATSEMLWTGCISGTLEGAAPNYNTRSNHFQRVRTTARLATGNTAYGARLTGGQGEGGTALGNTCFNTFITCAFFSRDAIGLKMENTDTNTFINCEASRTTGSAYSVELGSKDQDSSGGTAPGYSRGNTFFGGEYINGVHARSSQVGDPSSDNNVFYGFSQENGGPVPAVEAPAGGSLTATIRVLTVRGRIELDSADYANLADAPSNPASGLRVHARFEHLQVRTSTGVVRSLDPFVARKTSATVRNNTDVLAADPHLTVSVVSGGVYDIDAVLFYVASTTADVKIGWTYPASSVFLWGGAAASSGTTPGTGTGDFFARAAAATFILGAGSVAATVMARISGTLTAGADGTFALTWAQNVAEVSDTTLSAGSRMTVRRIA